MVLNKAPLYIVLSLCLITVYALFSIKDSVMTIRGELLEVNQQAQHEVDTIHLLKAELAYLTSPKRLSELNDDFLKLKETKVSQMISDPLQKVEHKAPIKQLADVKERRIGAVKWVYKKGPPKYVTLVSGKK